MIFNDIFPEGRRDQILVCVLMLFVTLIMGTLCITSDEVFLRWIILPVDLIGGALWVINLISAIQTKS